MFTAYCWHCFFTVLICFSYNFNESVSARLQTGVSVKQAAQQHGHQRPSVCAPLDWSYKPWRLISDNAGWMHGGMTGCNEGINGFKAKCGQAETQQRTTRTQNKTRSRLQCEFHIRQSCTDGKEMCKTANVSVPVGLSSVQNEMLTENSN